MHEGAVPGVARLTRDGAVPGEPGAVAVAVPGDPPTVLIAEPVSGPLPSLVLLHHIATGAALEIAQLTADQDRQRRLGEQLLGRLLDRRIDPVVAEPQIAEAGLNLAVSVLATARAGPRETGAGLHRALKRSRIPHLVLARDRMIQIVLPESAVVPGLATGIARARCQRPDRQRWPGCPKRHRKHAGPWAPPKPNSGAWSGSVTRPHCCCRAVRPKRRRSCP